MKLTRMDVACAPLNRHTEVTVREVFVIWHANIGNYKDSQVHLYSWKRNRYLREREREGGGGEGGREKEKK